MKILMEKKTTVEPDEEPMENPQIGHDHIRKERGETVG